MDTQEIEKYNEEVSENNKKIQNQKEKSCQIVENMFNSQKEFVVLGLCGKTGSGVSTISNILNSEFSDLYLPKPCEESKANIEKTEYRLLYNFAEINWKKFHKIKTSSLIVSRALCFDQNKFREYVLNYVGKDDNGNYVNETYINDCVGQLYNAKLTFDVSKNNYNYFFSDIEVSNDTEQNIKGEIGSKIKDLQVKVNEINKNLNDKINLDTADIDENRLLINFDVKDINKLFYCYMENRLNKNSYDNFLIYEVLYQYIYEKLPQIVHKFWFDLQEKLKQNVKTIILQDMGNNLRITKDNPFEWAKSKEDNSESVELEKDNFESDKLKKDGYTGIAELINISVKLLRDYKYKKITFINDMIFKNNISEETRKILKRKIIEENRTFIVIDSIKNPYESMYLKKRYSNYYLIAVYTDEKNRKERLEQNENLEQKDIRTIDITEQLSEFKNLQSKYGENSKEDNERLNQIIEKMNTVGSNSIYPFIMQNIQDCIELADIFINNKDESGSFISLKKKMLRYVSLIMYPGLVLPTSVERCMQIANTAKLCSGCISRQVGAVLTDNRYNVMFIGWNQQPENQVPCLYRSINEVRNHCNQEAYSDYENDDKKSFQCSIKGPVDDYYQTDKCNILKQGRSISYCFKDIYNEIKNDKNQIHPRSLHAEETAFLNLNRTGTDSIKGGFLFTTSSPCELCSKKAIYMGITKIYYVQPYPGISNEHVLSSGKQGDRPELELYTGAIGRAYTQLYTPLIPKKDELELWMGHKVSIKNYIKKEKNIRGVNGDESK